MRTVCHWDRCDSVLDVCCYCSYDWITSLSTSCSGTDCWITFHCVPLWLVLIKKKLVSGAQLNLRIRSCVAAIAQMMWLNADDRLWCFHGEAFCHLGWCDIGCLMGLLLFDVTWFVLSDTIRCLGASRTEAVWWFNLRRAPLRPVWRCVRCLLLLFMWLDHKSKQELFWDRLLNSFALCATVTDVQLR